MLGPQTKILVVDDDESIIDQVSKILEKLGVKSVDCAVNETDAVKAFTNKKYDFAIVDLHMPQESGVSVINFIKNNSNKMIQATPLLVLYGHISNQEIQFISEFPFTKTCKKPFTESNFIESLLNAMKSPPITSASLLPDQVDYEYACKVGNECLYSGDLEMARSYVEPKYIKNKMSPRLTVLMGQIHFGSSDLALAEKMADDVLASNRLHLPALNLKSKVLVAKGSYDEALVYMEIAQTISPLNIQRLIGMGEIHLANGRLKMALEKFERAYKSCPTDEAAIIGMAKVKIEMGETDEGIMYLNQLKDTNGAISDINLRAVILAKTNCFRESVTLYDRAIKCSANEALLSKLQYNKALAYIRVKKIGSAKDCLEESIRHNSKNDKAKDMLLRLDRNKIPNLLVGTGEARVVLSDRQKQLIFGSMHSAIKNTEE